MKLSIASRIFIGFSAVIAAFTAVTLFSLSKLHSTGEQLRLLSECYIPLTKTTTQIEAFYQSRKATVNRILEVQDPKARNIFMKIARLSLSKGLPEKIRQARQTIDKAKGAAGEDPDFQSTTLKHLEKLAKVYNAYGQSAEALFAQLEAASSDTSGQEKELRRTERDLLKQIKLLSLSLDKRITDGVMKVQHEEQTSAWILMVLTCAALLLGVGITLISQFMLSPLTQVTDAVKRLSAGEYSHRVEARSSTEIGILAVELNKTAEVLQAREGEIKSAYEKLRHSHVELEALRAYNVNILQSIRIGILVADRDLRVTFMNRVAADMWGGQTGEGYKGDLFKLPFASEIASQRERVKSVVAGGAGLTLGTVEIKRESDQQFVEINVHPLLDSRGVAIGALILGEDISEKERVRAQLLRSERLAAMGKLAAQITHEIRNPLNSLALNTELLRDEIGRLDPGKRTQAESLADAVAAEVDRLAAITEEYLGFVRPSQKRQRPQDLNEIIQGTIQFFGGELAGKGVALRAHLAEGLPLVNVDENQIRQALINLLKNSLESMPSGGAIAVKTSLEGSSVRAEISDTGHGISEELLPRIFDSFFSTKETGTGLGLALTQQIVSEHGGEIFVSSRVGEGTLFVVRLPAVAG